MAPHISICCPTSLLQEDDPCIRATLIKEMPQPASYAHHPSSCCTNSSSPHGTQPCFGNPNSDHPGRIEFPVITPPHHPLTQIPSLTNSRGRSFQTSTFNPKMLHQFLTLWHQALYLESSHSHRMINLLLRI